MSKDSVELQKIRNKISNLRKWKADALITPTFSQQVIDQFNSIFDKINLLDEQNKFSISHNRQFIEKIAKYIPKLVELSYLNFFQTAITDFNTQLSSIYMQVSELSDLASSATAIRGKIIQNLKQINPLAFMISYHKVSPAVFNKIPPILVATINELRKLADGASKDQIAQYQTLIQQLNDIDASLKHLIAAHNFIFTAESLQNSLRRLQQQNPDITLQLHQLYIQPVKPITFDNETAEIVEPTNASIDDILNQIRENPDDRAKLIPLLERTYYQEYQFSSPAKLLQGIISVILTIHPPIDLKSKLFKKSFQLFKFLASSIQFLLQLPDFIYSKAEIQDFEESIINIENSVDSITKARKKPAGWTADKSKLMIQKFEDYIIVCKHAIQGAEVAEMINTELEPYKIALNLTQFKLIPVDTRFTLIHYPESRVHFITSIRALNAVAEDLLRLSDNELHLRERRKHLVELHGVSFMPQFKLIQETTEKLETDIFRFSISQYNDFPVSKSGVTILSIFAELQRNLDYSLLQMHEISIELLNFRLLSLSLFEQGFSLTNDSMIDDVLQSMSLIYDCYVVFSKLQIIGSVSVTNAAHICYLITTCDELSEYDETFVKHRDYFQSVNLLDINNEILLEHINLLLQDTSHVFENWSCSSIVSQFNQYTKTIYTCSTQLKKVPYIDPLLTKLLAQLSSWLGNLSRTLPKPTNLREMQIRMTVLQQLFTNFVETNEEIKKQIPFDQLIEVIQLFKKLRDAYSTKTKLKQLLCFLERIQVSVNDNVESTDENSSVECDEASMQHSDSHDSSDAQDQSDSDENVKFDFTLEEINSWIEFSQTILKSSCYQRKKEFPVNSLSPKLIFNHFKELVTKYCDMWRLETSFSDEIAQEFLPMLSLGVEMTIPSLDHFFTSNYKHYESFRDKMMILIQKHFDNVIKSLSEFTPTPRGRGFQREQQPVHPNAQEISDVNKSLQLLSQNITNTDFSWYPELVRLYHQLNPLLGEATIGSDGTHPSSSFRRLCRKAYLCFLLTRCFHIFSAHNIPYGPDLESLRCLITDFMEDPTLANDNTAMRRHQIEEIMNSEIGSDTFVFGNSMDSLRRALSLINIKAVVEMIDADFFSFDEFFSKLPINVSSLSTLLSSSLFQSVEAARKAMFVLISTNYDDTIAYKSLKALQNFLREVSNAPFEIDKSTISTSMKACRIIQSLSDASTTFDCLDVFTPRPKPNQDINLMNGSYVLRVRILLIALEERMEILMNLASDQFSKLFQLTRPVIDSLSNIPDSFGFIDASQPAFEELREAWMNLCNKFTPINLIPQMARFKEISKSIPSVFLDSAEHPDIQAITQKALTYAVTHDPSYLIQIQMSYLFLEKQVKRYIPNTEFITFPFCEVQNILTVLMKFNEVCALIPCITERINAMNIGQPIMNPRNYEIEDLNEFPNDSDLDNSNEPPLLGKPLEFEDQVKLAIMTDSLSNASLIAKEQIAQLAYQRQQEKCLEPFIERTTVKNDSLAILNRYISDPITSMKNKMREENTMQTQIDEVAELSKLEVEDKVEHEHYLANQLHFEKLFNSCLATEESFENQLHHKRKMANERELIANEVRLDQFKSIIQSIEHEKKIRHDFRNTIHKIVEPFAQDEAIVSNPNPQESNTITPVFVQCNELTNTIEKSSDNVEQDSETEEKSVAERMSEEKRKLESECSLLENYISSMKDIC